MNKTICNIGFWSGLAACVATVAFGVVQILQILGVLLYPWDQILIYGFSLCMVVPFMLEMLALHYTAPKDKKIWSHAALLFTTLYAAFVTANYVVQLATVIPMTLKRHAEGIEILKQTPHSLFWDFDAIGYAFMGLATLIAVPVFKLQGTRRRVRLAFLAHGFITPLILFVYFYPGFSTDLLFLAAPWIITAPLSMLLLALMFRNESKIKITRSI